MAHRPTHLRQYSQPAAKAILQLGCKAGADSLSDYSNVHVPAPSWTQTQGGTETRNSAFLIQTSAT